MTAERAEICQLAQEDEVLMAVFNLTAEELKEAKNGTRDLARRTREQGLEDGSPSRLRPRA
jgi:hypothetical protein